MALTFSNDRAAQLLTGADAAAVNQIKSSGQYDFGGKINEGEAIKIRNLLDSNAFGGQNVYDAVANPTGAPDFTDPFNARTSIGERLGLGDATSREEAAQQALDDFTASTRAQINAIRSNRDLSSGLATGFESQRNREAADEETNLINALSLARQQRQILEGRVNDEFDIFNNELATRRNLVATALQYGDTGVNVNMSIDQLTRRANNARLDAERLARKEAEEAAKEQYKEDLKAQLRSLGVSTKNSKGGSLSTSGLEKRLGEYNKEIADREKQKFDLEMENTRSLIANRGSSSDSEIDIDYSDKGIASLIDEGRNTKDTWQEIAETLEAFDIDTSPGSFADNYLRYKFLEDVKNNPLE